MTQEEERLQDKYALMSTDDILAEISDMYAELARRKKKETKVDHAKYIS